MVDPIDGTTNFASGQPMSAVSIGVAKDGQLRVAAPRTVAGGGHHWAVPGHPKGCLRG